MAKESGLVRIADALIDRIGRITIGPAETGDRQFDVRRQRVLHLRGRRVVLVPQARVSWGDLVVAADRSSAVLGLEAGLGVRWEGGR